VTDRPRPSWPWLLAYAPALLLPVALGAGQIGAVAWSLACFFGAEAAFPGARTRHPAGALLAVVGGAALLFLSGSGMRPVAGLLSVPAFLFVGLAQWPRARSALRAAPLLTAVAYGGVVAALFLLGPFPTPDDDFLFGLRASPVPDALDDGAREAAVALVRAAITGEDVDPSAAPEALLTAPEGRVFVTLIRPTTRGRLARGQAREATLAASLVAAARGAIDAATPAKAWQEDARTARIWIDLAGPEEVIAPTWWRQGLAKIVTAAVGRRPRWSLVVYDAEPGLDGFALSNPETGKEGIFLPQDLLIDALVSPRSLRRRYRLDNFEACWKVLGKRAGLPGVAAASMPFRNFRTRSFAQPDPASPRTVELYRGNVLLPDAITEEQLLDGIDRAGRWLLGTVGDDGRFDYEYLPSSDKHGRGYNEVRHAGSVYGLFHMGHLAAREPSLAASSEDYVRAGLTALDRVYRNLGPAPGVDEGEGLITFLEGASSEKTNSGSPALTLLSFLERPRPEETDDPELKARLWRDGDDAIMEGLARTLERMIDDDGKVYRLWTEALVGAGVEEEPLYYPGEVMLALAKYHQRTGDPRWLAASQRIGRRQIPFSRRPWVVPDHWVMQALDVLDAIEPDSTEWRDGAYAMGRRYLGEQYEGAEPDPGAPAREAGLFLPRPPFPDYRGSYRRTQEVPRTTRAASRGEAIGGVVRIAWRRGDPSAHWERSLLDGGRHLMEQMYTPDNSFYFPDPEEGLGAIRMGIIDNHVRIDNNQHGVVGLSNALDALRRARNGS
jgi:hypothetical protein